MFRLLRISFAAISGQLSVDTLLHSSVMKKGVWKSLNQLKRSVGRKPQDEEAASRSKKDSSLEKQGPAKEEDTKASPAQNDVTVGEAKGKKKRGGGKQKVKVRKNSLP